MTFKGGGLKRSLIALVIILFVSLILLLSIHHSQADLEITFIDVGQGDASLIETPFGQNILIDSGEGNAVIKGLGKVLPWWDRQIDLMILTHPHSDHLGGMIDVLRRYKVIKVLYTGAESSEADFSLWMKLVQQEKADLVKIDHPQTIKLGENCKLDILYPFDENDIKKNKNLNNTSIVAKLYYKEKKFLFMGDLEADIEKALLGKNIDLEADIIKIGHHGSDTSSSEKFLESVGMDMAVISVGIENDFGHPSTRILQRLKRDSVSIHRTDEEGSIRIRSDGESISGLK